MFKFNVKYKQSKMAINVVNSF